MSRWVIVLGLLLAECKATPAASDASVPDDAVAASSPEEDAGRKLSSTIYVPSPTSLPPNGNAGGALTGTFPAPGIALDAGASLITGQLPAANQSAQTMGGTGISGTTAALAIASSALPSISTTGDVACSGTAGALTSCNVAAVSGSTPVPITPNELQWVSTATGPKIDQASESTATKAADFEIDPQTSTHTTDQGGGNLVHNFQVPTGAGAESGEIWERGGALNARLGGLPGLGGYAALHVGHNMIPSASNAAVYSPDGVSEYFNAATILYLAISTANYVSLTPSAFAVIPPASFAGAISFPSPQTLACSTGGTVAVASAPTPGLIVTSGTLSSNCTLDFSNVSTGFFTLDMSGATVGASFGIVFKNGSATKTYTTASVIGGTLATVWTRGANTLAVNY